MLFKLQKFTIPKAEKRKLVPEEPEGKPLDLPRSVEARTVMAQSEVPDYFSSETPPIIGEDTL